jgi:hypothetical protein
VSDRDGGPPLLSLRHPATAGVVSGLVLLVLGVPATVAVALAPHASEPDALFRFAAGYVALVALVAVLVALLAWRARRPRRTAPDAGPLVSLVRAFGWIVLVVLLVALDLTLVMPASVRGLVPAPLRQAAATPAPTALPRPSPTEPGTAASTAEPSPQPTPSPSPSPLPPGVLYQANWSAGMAGWVGTGEWTPQPGRLVSDGSGTGGDSVLAPYQPASPDFAVEAVIRAINPNGGCYFGIVGRSTSQGHYTAGFNSGRATIGSTRTGVIAGSAFDPGTGSHSYRAEFRGNRITLSIDGSAVTQATDSDFLASGQIGLASAACQIEVSGYRVLSLPSSA